MIVCPDCGFENIEGIDSCESCQQPLNEMSLRVPSSSVEASLLRDQISLLSPKKPSTVAPTTPVKEVLQKISDESIGCVVVVEEEKPVGIFSERDAILKLNIDAGKLANHPVSEYMTPNPETLDASDKIVHALHKMDIGGYRHIPIVDGERLTGIISIRDILAYLTAEIEGATV